MIYYCYLKAPIITIKFFLTFHLQISNVLGGSIIHKRSTNFQKNSSTPLHSLYSTTIYPDKDPSHISTTHNADLTSNKVIRETTREAKASTMYESTQDITDENFIKETAMRIDHNSYFRSSTIRKTSTTRTSSQSKVTNDESVQLTEYTYSTMSYKLLGKNALVYFLL